MIVASFSYSVVNIVLSLLILVFLACLLFGAIYAVVRVGKQHGAAAAIGLAVVMFAVPLLAAVALYSLSMGVKYESEKSSFATLRSQETGDQLAAPAPRGDILAAVEHVPAISRDNSVQVNALPNTPAVSWVPATELGEFGASLYPGIVECGEALAERTNRTLREILPRIVDGLEERSRGEGIKFLIQMDDDAIYRGDSSVNAFANTFKQALQKRFPDATLTLQSGGRDKAKERNDDEIILSLSTRVERGETATWDPSIQSTSGTAECLIQGRGKTTVRFANKPWVTRFDELVSKFPNRQFVVGYSSELASSETQARQSALENVRSQVQVKSMNGSMWTIADEHVVDRFAQKLSRPYGDVWREAVLVDLNGDRAMATADAIVSDTARTSEIKHVSILSGILFLLATVGVCFVANVLTQGYYRKPIRGGALTVIVIVFVFVGGLFLLRFVNAY